MVFSLRTEIVRSWRNLFPANGDCDTHRPIGNAVTYLLDVYIHHVARRFWCRPTKTSTSILTYEFYDIHRHFTVAPWQYGVADFEPNNILSMSRWSFCSGRHGGRNGGFAIAERNRDGANGGFLSDFH
ncbi:hypothetical protein PIB30_059562 [Stylosanthes scabra]|uniref:Uncharacterized protein n=1 Tax=Stylosanthes scabra TaxID=79078 RepID=A0ABU6ZIZ6_9FABA|nr:hypothetical protein [Stylosanthes scabra]